MRDLIEPYLGPEPPDDSAQDDADEAAADALRCYIPLPPPPPGTVDVTDVVHVATRITIDLRDAIVKRGRQDVVAALDAEDVLSTLLDEVVLLAQQVMVELNEGSNLARELAAIKRDDIGRAAGVVIAAYDEYVTGVDDTLDTSARG